MKPTRYQFFICRQIYGYSVNGGKRLDLSTGEMVDYAGYRATAKIGFDSKYIYIYAGLDSSSYEGCGICFYDEDEAFISSIPYSNATDGGTVIYGTERIIKVPDGAKFAAFSFSTDDDLMYNGGSATFYEGFEIRPYYDDLKKKREKEDNQMFFRTELEGTIKLCGTDYYLMKNFDVEDKLLFLVSDLKGADAAEGIAPNKYAEYYRGATNKTQCTFDHSLHQCELETEAQDQYNKVLAGYDNEYDLIRNLHPDVSSVYYYQRYVMQLYEMGTSTVTNYAGGTWWEEDTTENITDTTTLTEYGFYQIGGVTEFIIEDGGDYPEIEGVYADWDGENYRWTGANSDYYIGFRGTANSADVETSSGYIGVFSSDGTCIAYSTDLTVSYYKTVLGASGGYLYGTTVGGISGFQYQRVREFTFSGITLDIVSHVITRRLLSNFDEIFGTPTSDIPSDDFAGGAESNYTKVIGLATEGTPNLAITTVTSEKNMGFGMYEAGKYYTDEFASSIYGRMYPVSKENWLGASLWTYFGSDWQQIDSTLCERIELPDAYKIGDVIAALLGEIDSSIKHECTEEYSEFLYGSTASSIGAKLYMTQKTNILTSGYDQAAQTGETTLETIMEMLRDCFRCYWFIDEQKRFRIEHVRWFMNGGTYSTEEQNVQLDLTSKSDQFNKKAVLYGQGEVEYDRDELSARYEFEWGDDVTEHFEGIAINALSAYVPADNTSEISISDFTTDIDLMLAYPDNFSEDGWALLGAVQDGEDWVVPIVETTLYRSTGRSYWANVQNYYLSWNYLVNYYLNDFSGKWYRFTEGQDPREERATSYPKRIMKHTVEYQSQDDPDEMQLIRTEIGDGAVSSVEIDLTTRMIEVTLEYEPG